MLVQQLYLIVVLIIIKEENMKEYFVAYKDNIEFEFETTPSFNSYEAALEYKNKQSNPSDYEIWEVD